MSSITERIESAIAVANAVDAALPEKKFVGLARPEDTQRVMRGIIHTAARDAAWKEAAVHVFQTLPDDSTVSLSFIDANVPLNGSIEYPDEAGRYAVQRAADAVTWICQQPNGMHKRIALLLASHAGVQCDE